MRELYNFGTDCPRLPPSPLGWLEVSAVILFSPSPSVVFIGQAMQLRGQVRDSETRRPYDLTGATFSAKLISLTGGTARTLAAAPVAESLPNGTFTSLISAADTTALAAAGRWYYQLSCAGVTAEGSSLLVPDLYPLDVKALQ